MMNLLLINYINVAKSIEFILNLKYRRNRKHKTEKYEKVLLQKNR